METDAKKINGAAWLRFAAGGLFVYAGVLKALDPASFADDIGRYRLLPFFADAPLALYLPWLEITCGLALIAGLARRGALAVLLALTALFTLALASALARGLDLDCGCFGPAHPTAPALALARNFVLGAALVWLRHRD
jgi:uncharacterized membrane protein YphA (DoxX/SURF4 family)